MSNAVPTENISTTLAKGESRPKFTDLLREMKQYFLRIFGTITNKSHSDLREVVKELKQDKNAKKIIATFLTVTESVVELGLQGLHELLIADAHTIPYSKQQLIPFIHNICQMIKQHDFNFSNHILSIWDTLNENIFSIISTAKRLTVSKQYLLHCQEISSEKLQNIVNMLIKNDAITIVSSDTIKITVTESKSISYLSVNKFTMGKVQVHVKEFSDSTRTKFWIGPFDSTKLGITELTSTIELLYSIKIISANTVPPGSVNVVNNYSTTDKTGCVIEVDLEDVDNVPSDIEILTHKYTCHKIRTDGLVHYLYSKINNSKPIKY